MKPVDNTVVHLKTQEEYNEYMRMCVKEGWKGYCVIRQFVPSTTLSKWLEKRQSRWLKGVLALSEARGVTV